MSSKITGGQDRNDMAAAYDRLRKRSYRKLGSKHNLWRGRFRARRWTRLDHDAYVAGVRDGLNAAAEIMQP